MNELFIRVINAFGFSTPLENLVERWPDGDDPRRIKGFYRIVATLDVVEIHGFRHAGPVKHAPAKLLQIAIICTSTQIALKQSVIGDIEADERDEKTDIAVGRLIAEEKYFAG
jgi:hypothetical protein